MEEIQFYCPDCRNQLFVRGAILINNIAYLLAICQICKEGCRFPMGKIEATLRDAIYYEGDGRVH